MKLILDNNSLFAIMNPKSVSAYLFSSINSEFFAPEFLRSELKEHKEECLIKSNLSEQEFEIRQKEIEELIKFFKTKEYETFLDKASDSISDIDDIDFLALAFKLNCAIWSNDMHLKEQSLVPVYTTKELVEKFLKREL